MTARKQEMLRHLKSPLAKLYKKAPPAKATFGQAATPFHFPHHITCQIYTSPPPLSFHHPTICHITNQSTNQSIKQIIQSKNKNCHFIVVLIVLSFSLCLHLSTNHLGLSIGHIHNPTIRPTASFHHLQDGGFQGVPGDFQGEGFHAGF